MDGLSQRAFRWQAPAGRFQPGLKVIQNWFGLLLAPLAFNRWGLVADHLLDGVKAPNPRERFGGGGRITLHGDVVELPPRMHLNLVRQISFIIQS